MKDEENIVSGFGSEGDGDVLLKVDFASAKPLGRGGSTCDAYECVIQRRRVFVKRLKAEFRDNPFYRAAFDKEYDLGVSLSHPSLPRYVGLGCDYIIMDYIEGDTLADLIKRGDLRLKDRKFCRKILSELVDVVEYLHYRNIVHCDIKADNIMIPPYAGRPVTLIDFDKAYTAWLDGTAGDPAKYGCEDCADGRIDFRGIGRIAGMLGQKRVAAACQDKDAAIDGIRKALGRPGDRKWIWTIVIGMSVLCVTALLMVNRMGNVEEMPEVPAVDTVVADTVRVAADTLSVFQESPIKPAPSPSVAGAPVAGESGELDEIVNRYYGPLSRRHDYLRTLAADTNATVRQLKLVIGSYAADQMEAQNLIISKVTELYGLGDPLESVTILATRDSWNRFMEHDYEINQLYLREIGRRRREEARTRAVTASSMSLATDSLSR